MKTQYILVDGRFPSTNMSTVINLISEGWVILDKSIIDNRYIMFILVCNVYGVDIGKTSESIIK